MADYRAHILDGEASADGNVMLDCYIQKLTDPGPPEVWTLVPNGHRTMVLNGAAVLAITQHPTWTDAEKLAALVALFCQTAESWGVAESDEAETELEALLPSGWPVNVDL